MMPPRLLRSLHRILAGNFYVLDKEERDMARLLLRSGHGALLANWPRAGVHDTQKRALVRRAARELGKVTAAVATERLATLKVRLRRCTALRCPCGSVDHTHHTALCQPMARPSV